jgi:hypothetical protein
MFNPTLRDLEIIAEMSYGGMSSERIAAALGITTEGFAAWTSRLAAANALDPETVDRLLYSPKPRAVQAPHSPPTLDCRIVAERIFEAAAE